MANKHSNRKSPLNTHSLQAGNPLIGIWPSDTWNNVDAVLALLQERDSHTQDFVDDQANWGAFMVLKIVRDAIHKQAAALTSKGGGSNG